jgi:hypothetical protein
MRSSIWLAQRTPYLRYTRIRTVFLALSLGVPRSNAPSACTNLARTALRRGDSTRDSLLQRLYHPLVKSRKKRRMMI